MHNIEELWNFVFNIDENFKNEILYLLRYKKERTYLKKGVLSEKLSDWKGILLTHQQIDALQIDNIIWDIGRGASPSGTELWVNKNWMYIITKEDNEHKYGYKNKYYRESKTLSWYAPNTWEVDKAHFKKTKFLSEMPRSVFWKPEVLDEVLDKTIEFHEYIGDIKKIQNPETIEDGKHLKYELLID